jgi:hypothetical protein
LRVSLPFLHPLSTFFQAVITEIDTAAIDAETDAVERAVVRKALEHASPNGENRLL